MTDIHVGRSWTDNRLEQFCPCPLEPCGLVARDKAHPDCEEHTTRARTMRQIHETENCPGPRPFHPTQKRAVGSVGLRADIQWKQDPLGEMGRRFYASEHPYSFAMWESPDGQWGYDVTDRGAWPPQLLVRTTVADEPAARAQCQRVWDELHE